MSTASRTDFPEAHATPAGARWRLVLSPPATGVENMALDEALMEHARRTNEWVLRIYGWREPTLSLGRNQRAAGSYDEARLSSLGIAVVRRPTGGRAILHHREVTYAVGAPIGAAGDLRESYGRINRLLLSGLRALGVDAVVVDSVSRAQTPGLAPCFDHPSVGELVVAGRKLVGSAQWRQDGALLQHGSILVEDDQSMVATLTTEVMAPPPRPATLRDALGYAPSLEAVAAALFGAVRAEDPASRDLGNDTKLQEIAASLAPRYRDREWTWRR